MKARIISGCSILIMAVILAIPSCGQSTADIYDGLYVGLSLRTSFDLTQRVDKLDHVVFFPDGTFLWRFPEEGLEDFDRVRSMKEYPNFWGTYKVEKDRVLMRYNTASRDIIAQKNDNGKLYIENEASLFPVSKLNGQILSGTYWRVFDDPANRPSGPIAFYSDGTFEDAGGLNDLGLWISRPGYPMEIPPGVGTYRIANNTLTLNYSDGWAIRLTIFTLESSPSSLFINRKLFELQKE